MLRHLMTSKNLKSKILNFDFLENEKSLWRKTKNIFPSLTSTLVYTWKTRSQKCSGHNLFIIHFFLHFNVHWIHVVKALFQQKIRPESPILYEKIIKKIIIVILIKNSKSSKITFVFTMSALWSRICSNVAAISISFAPEQNRKQS